MTSLRLASEEGTHLALTLQGMVGLVGMDGMVGKVGMDGLAAGATSVVSDSVPP